MNLAIFGASGRTGHELMKQALAQSHRVTACVRQPNRVGLQHENLRIVQVDITNPEQVRRAVHEQDAVVSTLGPHTLLRRVPALVSGIRNMVSAMQAENVDELLYTSALGVGESLADQNAFFRYLIRPVLLGRDYADHEANEQTIRNSSLRWTIIRPARLVDGPRSGNYQVAANLSATFPFGRITRADVADFLVKQLAHPTFIHQSPGLLGFKSFWAS
jgi:putative NADH-flavin reductase